jgi:hypothetical protein
MKYYWTNYDAHVVQIRPISNWFGRSLSFSWELHENLWTLKDLVICEYNMIHYSIKLMCSNWHQIFGSCFTQKIQFDTRKIENELFMQRKGKHPKWTLFDIPSCTHLDNMMSFVQTMPWFWWMLHKKPIWKGLK